MGALYKLGKGETTHTGDTKNSIVEAGKKSHQEVFWKPSE
jgi:hypothetical protein